MCTCVCLFLVCFLDNKIKQNMLLEWYTSSYKQCSSRKRDSIISQHKCTYRQPTEDVYELVCKA